MRSLLLTFVNRLRKLKKVNKIEVHVKIFDDCSNFDCYVVFFLKFFVAKSIINGMHTSRQGMESLFDEWRIPSHTK